MQDFLLIIAMHRFSERGKMKVAMQGVVDLATQCIIAISQILSLENLPTDSIIKIADSLYFAFLLPGSTK